MSAYDAVIPATAITPYADAQVFVAVFEHPSVAYPAASIKIQFIVGSIPPDVGVVPTL